MDKPRRILVTQLKRAGDVIVTTPVLSALRKALPGARIDFLVDGPFASLLEHHPVLQHVVVYNRSKPWKTIRQIRASQYDWMLDFQSSPRSILAGLLSGVRLRAGYRVPFWGHFLSFTVKRPGGDLSVTEGKMTLVRALLPGAAAPAERHIELTTEERRWAAQSMVLPEGGPSAVGLIPTHRRASRRWVADSFAAVGQWFANEGRPVWLFWGPGEEEYVSAIQQKIPKSVMIPRASLRQMAALLERCGVVITNDNGPMHLAEAVHTPTVTIYGPTDPKAWNAGSSKERIVQAEGLSCLGCNLNECPINHECMVYVTPERVIHEAAALLSGTEKTAR